MDIVGCAGSSVHDPPKRTFPMLGKLIVTGLLQHHWKKIDNRTSQSLYQTTANKNPNKNKQKQQKTKTSKKVPWGRNLGETIQSQDFFGCMRHGSTKQLPPNESNIHQCKISVKATLDASKSTQSGWIRIFAIQLREPYGNCSLFRNWPWNCKSAHFWRWSQFNTLSS